jgi:transcriptional regulator with PAS, ATPase and Fis domain
MEIVGSSSAITDVLHVARRAAETDANVYIFGENGTGKELIARAIHHGGPRRDRPLVTLDCTAIPEGLMESQLFGHTRGAFTGAVMTRPGVLRVANAGTLFIDEIGDLSLPLQAKLLRAIQFREFTMVGGTQSEQSDVRFIVATNRDLKRAVAEGKFRADLYYRVAVIQIRVPPLRARAGDIPELAVYFVSRFSARYGKRVRGITDRAMALVRAHEWPGNVRQLENCLEQAVIFSSSDLLDVRDFEAYFDEHPGPSAAPPPPQANGFGGQSLRELEAWYIAETLKRFGGNRTKTAKHIGVSLRGLQYKLKRYALDEPA